VKVEATKEGRSLVMRKFLVNPEKEAREPSELLASLEIGYAR
jgi:hypothetical protein